MSRRRDSFDATRRRAIGAEVLAARAAGVTWKRLEQRFDRCRRQLWRYALAVMSQENPVMSHRDDCAAPRAA